MALAKKYKKIKVFSNDVERIDLEFDVAAGDTGVVGIVDLAIALEAFVIHKAIVKVKTGFVGATATLEVGIKAGDTDAILAASLPAALTAPKTIAGAAASDSLLIAANAVIAAEIKVAPFTAGKIVIELEISKF